MIVPAAAPSTATPRRVKVLWLGDKGHHTPVLRARTGQDVEVNVFGMDSMFHTFHIHGHRWRDAAGTPVDNPGFGPNETVTARFIEDNPGRWLYHCPVFTHQDMGMAGWYLVA